MSVAQIGPVHVPAASPPPEEIAGPQGFVPPQLRPGVCGILAAGRCLPDRFGDHVVPHVAGWFALSIQVRRFFPIRIPHHACAFPQLTPLAIALGIPMVWLYYAIFEASPWQATPGKRVLRLYVTDLDGRPITFARATIRHFGKMISSLTFLAGLCPCGIYREEAGVARHHCQLPCAPAALGALRRTVLGLELSFTFLCK